MKERLNSIFGYLICISAILMILITVVDMICFNTDFYRKEYQKYESPQSIGVSEEDLMVSTTTLLDYLKGDREDIVVEINLKGNLVEAFNSKETMHMVDVKALYDGVMNLRLASLLILVGGFIHLIVKMKQEALVFVAERFSKTAVCFALIIGFLGVYIYVDFNGFWTNFHQLFFTNDLWLLDSSTDFMINMFPEELFFDMVLRITFFFIVPFILCIVLCLTYLKKERLHIEKNVKESI